MERKHNFFRCIILLVVVCISAMSSVATVKIGDLYYELDSTSKSAKVVNQSYYPTAASSYVSGNIEIPASVVYDGTKYPVTSIGNYAFYFCRGLISVDIPKSVTSIGAGAFYNCSGLTSIIIPNSVTSIGSGAFNSCSGLTSIIIPNSVTSIGSGAFNSCSGLTSVVIPNSITSIASHVFNNCINLKSVIIPSTVTSIGDFTFSDCSSLISIVIPNSIISIGNGAFSGCNSLTSIVIPNSIISIGNGAFSGCNSLTSIVIPNTLTSIGDQAFHGCSDLSSVVIPNSVSSIGYQAFYGCSGLSSVVIPNSVSSIGYQAFYGCSGLSSVVIPTSVTSIGDQAFYDCSSINNLTFNATNCSSCGPSSFPSTISILTFGNDVTKIPANLLSNGSQIKSVTLPSSLTSIGTSAFRNSTHLKSIKFPETVNNIGDSAFYACNSLTSIEIPSSVTLIGDYAFGECSSITNLTFNASNCESCGTSSFPSTISTLTFGSSVTKIPSNFLYNGSLIENVTFPSSLTSIGASAFRNNTQLKSIEIPEAVTVIGNSAFNGCSQLTNLSFNATNCSSCGISSFPSTISTLTFGNGVTKIPDFFLYDGNQIESVIFPSSLLSIGHFAFRNSSYIYSFVIPQNVKFISNAAFNGCYSLAKNAYPSSIDNPFPEGQSICYPQNCYIDSAGVIYNNDQSKLYFAPIDIEDNYTIPNSVTLIGYSAFAYCYNLRSVVIPNSVTYIDDYAFYDLRLQSLTLGSGLQYIGSKTFSNYWDETYIKKVFWLGNTPPTNARALKSYINYVSNDRYNLSNQKKYQFLSSKFTVDGTVYVPVSPSERTCDVIDCDYSLSDGNIMIRDKVTYKGIEMSVININDYSFDCCNSLTNLTASNVGYIGEAAFSNCHSLVNATIGNAVTSIGYCAFIGCHALTTITLPDNVSAIGKSSFLGCSNLSSVKIGKGITIIPRSAFEDCSSLNNLLIPYNVKSIGNDAFSGCKSLSKLKFEEASQPEDDVTSTAILQLDSNGSKPLFSDCPLDEVYIGRKLSYSTASSSGYSPFYRNTYLRSVEITDAETQIYDNEFYGCSNLKSLKIGDGVKTIGKWAFSGCKSLDYFSAGHSVESIGEEAFSDCTALTKFHSYSAVPPTCGNQALDDINKWECTLYVPRESIDEYRAAPQWKEFFFIEEMENADSGIDSIHTDSNTTSEIYTLNGYKVSTPVEDLKPGIYIVKQGDAVQKLVIR